jgi:hypothetical protein
MRNFSLNQLIPLIVLTLLFGLPVVASAQEASDILSEKDLTRVIPTSFYFQGQSAPTQMRNAAAARLAADKFVLAGLVDTSGYSSEVRGKYEGFLITDSPITLSGTNLVTGAYGFGFSSDGKMNIFDVGGKQIMSVEASKDKDLKRPRPLAMVRTTDEIRLYSGRNYVTISAK